MARSTVPSIRKYLPEKMDKPYGATKLKGQWKGNFFYQWFNRIMLRQLYHMAIRMTHSLWHKIAQNKFCIRRLTFSVSRGLDVYRTHQFKMIFPI